MAKDKYTIINEMVANTAYVMESKAEELEMTAEGFERKGDHERAARWREDLADIARAVTVIRKLEGCWA